MDEDGRDELDRMPARWTPRILRAGGRTQVLHGPFVLFEFADDDIALRNMALVALTESGALSVKDAAAAFGLRPEDVSRLRTGYFRDGPAALAPKRPGRPPALTPAQVRQARAWAGRRVTQAEIARRLGVPRSVVSETLKRHGGPINPPDGLFDYHDDHHDDNGGGGDGDGGDGDGGDGDGGNGDGGNGGGGNGGGNGGPGDDGDGGGGDAGHARIVPARAGASDGRARRGSGGWGGASAGHGAGAGGDGGGAGRGGRGQDGDAAAPGAGARIEAGVFPSRFAGAMLVHAYTHRVGTQAVLAEAAASAPAGPAGLVYDEVGVLAAAQMAFSLGRVSVEQFKYLPGGQAGPLVGWDRLPSLRALRPRLAAIADAADSVGLLGSYFRGMLRADPGRSRVFYVDDHFIPYAGRRPVAKGWNNKRGRAERGRFDTLTVDRDGRACGFSTGEPSALSATLPPALGKLREAAGGEREILLGFDRGASYPTVFTQVRAMGVHWMAYRRAPLAATAHLPVLGSVTRSRSAKPTPVALADETVRLDGYHNGCQQDADVCRQVTVFERGEPAAQVLTSDLDCCALALLPDHIGRWGIENRLKYDTEHYGTDLICDYQFTIVPDERITDNPARKAANTAVKAARAALDRARADFAAMLADPAIPAQEKNQTLIGRDEKRITQAEHALRDGQAARDKLPAKIAANAADPGAVRAIQRANRRMLQMLLRLLAANAEHWLSAQLNAALDDPDEYRSITRNLIRGHDGVITYTPQEITVALARPASPRLAAARRTLLDQLNADPARIPGDPRPITYTIDS
jgi:transposase